MTKECRKCHVNKNIDEFYDDKKNINGHGKCSYCKKCHAECAKKYRIEKVNSNKFTKHKINEGENEFLLAMHYQIGALKTMGITNIPNDFLEAKTQMIILKRRIKEAKQNG